jgi:hypothetical protein
VVEVVDESGVNVSGEYLLDCAYRLQRVPGRDVKVGSLEGTLFRRVDSYLDELYELGIRHPYDSSVFVPGLSAGFTVIDIATRDAMAEFTELLELHGTLPADVRARCG